MFGEKTSMRYQLFNIRYSRIKNDLT